MSIVQNYKKLKIFGNVQKKSKNMIRKTGKKAQTIKNCQNKIKNIINALLELRTDKFWV